MTDLARKMRKVIRDSIYNDGTPAVLGRLDGTTLYFVDESGVTDRNYVWIRYLDANTPTVEVLVRNGGVPPQIGLPVRIISIRNVPTAITNRYGLQATQFSDGLGFTAIEAHAFTHKRLGTDPLYLNSLAFVPLLVRPSDPPALTVYVEPGWYRYLGTRDVWEGGNTASLSSYVPATTGILHFVIICLDRSTNTLAIVDGTDIGTIFAAAEITYNDIIGISIDEDYYPLATVELIKDQTTILASDINFDLRLWGMEVRSSAEVDIIDSIMTDSNGDVMSDSNGNVLTEN